MILKGEFYRWSGEPALGLLALEEDVAATLVKELGGPLQSISLLPEQFLLQDLGDFPLILLIISIIKVIKLIMEWIESLLLFFEISDQSHGSLQLVLAAELVLLDEVLLKVLHASS